MNEAHLSRLPLNICKMEHISDGNFRMDYEKKKKKNFHLVQIIIQLEWKSERSEQAPVSQYTITCDPLQTEVPLDPCYMFLVLYISLRHSIAASLN